MFRASHHCPIFCLDHMFSTYFDPHKDSSPDRSVFCAYILAQFVDEEQLSLRVGLSRSIAACGTLVVNHLVILSSRYWKLWKERWSHAYKTEDWTPWQFTLHYSFALSRTIEKLSDFVSAGFHDPFLDLIMSMIKMGGLAHESILVTVLTGNREISASAVLHELLMKIWEIQSSPKILSGSKSYSVGDAQSTTILAEKACWIEDKMKVLKATGWTRTLHPRVPNTVKSKSSRIAKHAGLKGASEFNEVARSARAEQWSTIQPRKALEEPPVAEKVFPDVWPSPWSQHLQSPYAIALAWSW